MAIFGRSKSKSEGSDDDPAGKKKGAWRRPANTAFKQQRLKAWQPILTPKTVLPTLFIIGIIFAPIGGLLVWGSGLVSEMTFDYTDCETLTPATSLNSLQFTDLPSDKYNYRLRSKDSSAPISAPPQYALLDNSQNSSAGAGVFQKLECHVRFTVPADFEHSVFLYYKLTNFFQNHRRYVKSLNSDQLKGTAVSASDLDSGDCKPLGSRDSKAIYPCGLIANSVFNDTFSNLTLLGGSGTFNWAEKGIAWPGESKKYVASPIGGKGYNSFDEIVPPPNWLAQFPNGYSNSTPPPDLHSDEHFQNWMRTAGLPTFTKLWGRNDEDNLAKGQYEIVIGLNFPVRPYKGTKSFVISTVSWIGGKNPFLGWAYVAASGLFVLLAIVGLARHLIKPRRLGDMSLLSWNRP